MSDSVEGRMSDDKPPNVYRDWCRKNGFQWMEVDPPGPNRKLRWTMPDGTMHEQDAPAEQKYIFTAPKGTDTDAHLRAIVREEVRRALGEMAHNIQQWTEEIKE